MVVRSLSWKATLAGLLFALPFGACDCGSEPPSGDAGPSLTCGAGTHAKDGECVPDEVEPPADAGPDLECGPGTVPSADGSQCVPDLNCPEGTAPTNDGTGCAPLCEDPFVLEGTECVCPAGLVPTPGGNDCRPDPALCAEGTIFDEGTQQCRPITAPPPADDDTNAEEAPVSFDLPAIMDKPVELGGIVGPIDRADGADLDVFEFDGTAGDRLLVQLVSFGAQAASFLLVGADAATEDYFRMAFPLENRRAVRHVVLPVTGRYAFIVSDRANILSMLGAGGIPVGGEDHTYSLVIDTLDPVPATTVPADGMAHTGAHDNIDAYRVDANATPAGSILNALLAGSDADPDGDTWQVLWYVDNAGNYVEIQPNAGTGIDTLLPQLGGGIKFYVDYLYRLGINPAWDYSLSVIAPTNHDGPAPGGGPLDGNTGGDDLTFYSIETQANHVYRIRMQLPATSTIDAELRLVDTQLNTLAASEPVTAPDGTDYQEIRFFTGVDGAGTYYVEVVDAAEQDPLVQPNFNIRMSLDEAEVVDSAVLSLPDSATHTASLDDPADLTEDTWQGPWALMTVASIADLTVTTDTDVTFRAFDATTFAPRDGEIVDTGDATVSGRLFRGPPGHQVLVQALGGDQTDQFQLSGTLTESPFSWETEPNDASDAANTLPSSEVPDLQDLTAAAPVEGACSDLANAPQITESGHYTATLNGPSDNFDRDTWGLCAPPVSGNDAYWVIPQQPAGTLMIIETLPTGDHADADTRLGLIQAPNDCDPTASACLAYNDDGGDALLSLLEYTWGGTEGDVVLLLDSWGDLTAGSVVFDVTFVPPPLSGFTQGGDADWWQITVTEAGLLDVNVSEGPLGQGPDVAVSLFASDGTTSLAGPEQLLMGSFDEEGGSLTAYVEPGTYYAVVEFVPEQVVNTIFGPITIGGVRGDYSIRWSVDPNVEAPSTCAAPIALSGEGTVSGDTSDGVGNWQPADASCFGFAPETYAGPDDVYSLTLAAGATLRATVTAGFDAALAVVDGACDGPCLVGADETFPFFSDASESVTYVNDSGAAMDLLLVVDGYSGDAGEYDLVIELFGDDCLAGEQRCNNDGNIEICNADGTGFDIITCPGGCEFDAFDQLATCKPYCGEGTANPNTIQCTGATLQLCSADGTRYEETSCAVECSQITDEGTGAVTDALCTFGLCAGGLGGTVCSAGVETSCNADASLANRVSCAAGCDGNGEFCNPPAINVLTNVPDVGACTTGTTPSDPITESGQLVLTLDGTEANDFDDATLACGSGSGSGSDILLGLGPKTAGTTVRVRVEGADLDPTLGFQLACEDAACIGGVADDGFGGDPEEATYTYDGTETTVLVVVDSWTSTWSGDLAVEVEFSDDPLVPVAPAICTADAATCDTNTNVLSACNAEGTAESQTYCMYGCNVAGDGCESLTLGESCDAPGSVPAMALAAGTFSFPVDLSGYVHDIAGECRSSSTGAEGIFAFTAPFDGHAIFETEGRDTVMYAREATCADGTELACDDDGGPGAGSRVEFDMTAGTEYFVVVELYSSYTTPTDITLTMSLSEQ